MPRVYIETTIPSYYFETRRTAEARTWRDWTRRWWAQHRAAYSLCTSTMTLNELGRAPATKARSCLDLLNGVAVLAEPQALEQLVRFYVEQRVMPRGPDAVHAAMASLHGVDYVLTWNCLHLANANKMRHLSVLNGRMGLSTPIFATPMSLIPESDP